MNDEPKTIKIFAGDSKKCILMDYELLLAWSSTLHDITEEKLDKFDYRIEIPHVQYKDLCRFKEWFYGRSQSIFSMNLYNFQMVIPVIKRGYDVSQYIERDKIAFVEGQSSYKKLLEFWQIVYIFDWLGIDILLKCFVSETKLTELYTDLYKFIKHYSSDKFKSLNDSTDFLKSTSLYNVIELIINDYQSIKYVELRNATHCIYIEKELAAVFYIDNAYLDLPTEKIQRYKDIIYRRAFRITKNFSEYISDVLCYFKVDSAITKSPGFLNNRKKFNIIQQMYPDLSRVETYSKFVDFMVLSFNLKANYPNILKNYEVVDTTEKLTQCLLYMTMYIAVKSNT